MIEWQKNITTVSPDVYSFLTQLEHFASAEMNKLLFTKGFVTFKPSGITKLMKSLHISVPAQLFRFNFQLCFLDFIRGICWFSFSWVPLEEIGTSTVTANIFKTSKKIILFIFVPISNIDLPNFNVWMSFKLQFSIVNTFLEIGMLCERLLGQTKFQLC